MKKYRLTLLHLTCWFSLPFVLTFFRWVFQFTQFTALLPGNKVKIVSFFGVWNDNLELNLAMLLIGASSFYLTGFIVFPAFNKPVKKAVQLISYVLVLLVTPFLILALMSIFSLAVAFFFRYFLFFAYLVQIPFVLAAIALGYLKNWYHSKQVLALIEKQAIKTELELLKSQINPHFLFNTINNIDTLIIKDPPLASKYLNELATLLRFMLYDVKTEKISLSKEMAYIEKYIRLQKIRSVNSNFIRLNIKGTAGDQQIAPLLFIPLVENAFKHGTDKLLDDSIKLDFEITPARVLFTCSNRFEKTDPETVNEDGLGLGIIGQRLALIYPGRHQFQVNKSDNYYEVSLTLFLDAN
jgi:hypothetical protein